MGLQNILKAMTVQVTQDFFFVIIDILNYQ